MCVFGVSFVCVFGVSCVCVFGVSMHPPTHINMSSHTHKHQHTHTSTHATSTLTPLPTHTHKRTSCGPATATSLLMTFYLFLPPPSLPLFTQTLINSLKESNKQKRSNERSSLDGLGGWGGQSQKGKDDKFQEVLHMFV